MLKRIVAGFLLLKLLLGMVPGVFADEITPETEEITNPIPTEDFEEDSSRMLFPNAQSGVMLFDYADNGNYTTVLKSQVVCAYKPNGNGTIRRAFIQNLGWHYARYDGTAYPDKPLYCIEPWRNYAAGTSGNSVDQDISLDGNGTTAGSNVWYALPIEWRVAIGQILLYSNQLWDHSISVTTTKKDANPNVPLRVATQFLVYEIVCGLRNPASFERNSVNECGTAGNVFFNMGAASIPGFESKYNALVSYVQSAKTIPSFTAESEENAPTITLGGDHASVTDSNEVLSHFSFSDGNGARFHKDGNTLSITKSSDVLDAAVFLAVRNIPSASASGYNLWYMTGSTYQTTISLCNAATEPLRAYFKLEAPVQYGSVSMVKTTNTGENLSGWKIDLFRDTDCTDAVPGSPFVTGIDGAVIITDLLPGTYFAREQLGEDGYWDYDTAVKSIAVAANQTASVTFRNIHYGKLRIRKTVSGGRSAEGWQFKISDADGNTLGGSPFTTDKDGLILTGNLLPGTYTVEELLPEDSPYQCIGQNPQTVTVKQGQTAEADFTNILRTGSIRIEKIDTAGEHLSGATFLLEWSAEGALWYPVIYSEEPVKGGCSNPNLVDGTLTTGDDGVLLWDNLYSGLFYRVTELKAPNGYQKLLDYAFVGELPEEDLQLSLQVVNVKVYTLPETGVNTELLMRISRISCTVVCAAMLFISFRKKRS